MPSLVHKRGSAKVDMNMTPLIDVTFQLIIFFMLVNNIVAKEVVKMMPPKLEDPKTRELGKVERVVINVAPVAYADPASREQNPLNYPGEATTVSVGSTVTVGMGNLDVVSEQLKIAVASAGKDEKGESVMEVVLRADCAIYYEEVQQVMGQITQAGVSKINLSALMPRKKNDDQ